MQACGAAHYWGRVAQFLGPPQIGHDKAAVALVNKMVRICWAVWCHERRFSGNWQSCLLAYPAGV
jgi:hypothetical protein